MTRTKVEIKVRGTVVVAGRIEGMTPRDARDAARDMAREWLDVHGARAQASSVWLRLRAENGHGAWRGEHVAA